MDDRGYWHHSREEEAKTNIKSGSQDRPPFSVDFGEMVALVKANGEMVMGAFSGCQGTRVTIDPISDDKPRAVLSLMENVQLAKSSGESVPAQVWDNRGKKIILRTLPR